VRLKPTAHEFENRAYTDITDYAIFSEKLTANLGTKISEAVLPLGLPVSSLTAFIGDLADQNTTALVTVPGVTPKIIGAGVGGLYEAYSIGFRFVWIAAGCFTVIAAVCKFRPVFLLTHSPFQLENVGCTHLHMIANGLVQLPFSWLTPSKSLTCISTHQRRRRKTCFPHARRFG
jgi:hypothetical protein